MPSSVANHKVCHREEWGLRPQKATVYTYLVLTLILCLCLVNCDPIEFVDSSRMVEVNMGGDRQQGLIQQTGKVVPQTADSQPRINQEILTFPLDQPEICPIPFPIVNFADTVQTILDFTRCKPVVTNGL